MHEFFKYLMALGRSHRDNAAIKGIKSILDAFETIFQNVY